MNRILFYGHELEDWVSSDEKKSLSCDVILERDHIELCIPQSDRRAIHMREILQAKIHDTLKAGIVDHSKGVLKILEIASDSMRLEYSPAQYCANLSTGKNNMHVVLGHLRPPVMARVLRDLSSMSVYSITVHLTALVEKSYMQSKFWNAYEDHIIDGLMQGDQILSPRIQRFYSTKRALEEGMVTVLSHPDYKDTHTLKIVLHDEFEYGLHSLMEDWEGSEYNELVIAIGPERGYTEEDLGIFSRFGFRGAHLGGATLRSEVAVHIAVGLFQLIN